MSCNKPGFPRGTTPPLEFEVEQTDLTGWTVYLTFTAPLAFTASNVTVTKTGEDLSIEYDPETASTIVTTTLTQADTLALPTGTCEAQLRAVKDGEAIATEVVAVQVTRILMEGVIPPVVPDA